MARGFPQESRIRTRPEYEACYGSGRKYHSRNFVVFALAREHGSGPRLGIAVSRKVGSAVARNRVKRLLREFFRQRRRDLAALPRSLDLVFVAKRHVDAKALGLRDVEDDLAPLLGRILRECARS